MREMEGGGGAESGGGIKGLRMSSTEGRRERGGKSGRKEWEERGRTVHVTDPYWAHA